MILLTNRRKLTLPSLRHLLTPTSVPTGQGPILQVWPSGQITLTGDVIGSKSGTVRYDATIVFRDPAIKLW